MRYNVRIAFLLLPCIRDSIVFVFTVRNPAMMWEPDFAVADDPNKGDDLHTSCETSCVWNIVWAVLVAVCVLSICFIYLGYRCGILEKISSWKKIVCRLCGSGLCLNMFHVDLEGLFCSILSLVQTLC
jgi:hypothetical protein